MGPTCVVSVAILKQIPDKTRAHRQGTECTTHDMKRSAMGVMTIVLKEKEDVGEKALGGGPHRQRLVRELTRNLTCTLLTTRTHTHTQA
jgi:hypothetical protein